jgi:hypothetical protein
VAKKISAAGAAPSALILEATRVSRPYGRAYALAALRAYGKMHKLQGRDEARPHWAQGEQ